MSTRVEIPWGETTLEVGIPDHWRLLGVMAPKDVPALPSPGDVVTQKLNNPIGAPALRGRNLASRRIVIVVDDLSRPTPTHLLFKPLVEELGLAGARRENISLLMALGVHRPMTPGEVAAKVGEENLHGLAWYNHDPRDEQALAYLGVTSRGTPVRVNRRLADADLIICLGGIEPHVLVGFSGGLKAILPGCASVETIAKNHLQGVTPERFNLVGTRPERSPMRLDLEEASLMLHKEIFIVNAVLNHTSEICDVFCGHPVEAHRLGVELSEKIHGVPIPTPADVLMVGSSPMDSDLRQSMKCIGNTLFSARPGGHIMGFLRCERGIGDVEIPPKALPHQVLRTLLKLMGRKRIMAFVERIKKRAGVEEKFLAHFSLQVLRRNPLHVFSERLPADVGRRVGLFVQYAETSAMVAAVAKKAPKRATVWVFPFGGLTYPILPSSA